jgi:hypothetical protein
MEMMQAFVEGLDWLLSIYVNARAWFWLCVAVIVIGLIAIVGNFMEPGRPSF